MSGRFASGGGLLTATDFDVCALNCGETSIDSRIDTGLAVAALGVPGHGLLTVTGYFVQRVCSLPAGEIGVTASGHMLSQVALVIASGHAGDSLPLLPARGQKSQDSWPDEKRRRVLRRLSLSLLLFLKCLWKFLLRQEALFFIVTSVCSAGSCQVLFCACQDPLPWERFAVLRVWLRRLLGLGSVVPFDFAAGAVTIGAATAMPAGAGDPPAARCCAWRAWAYAASGGFPVSWGSASLVQWWVRLARSVTGGGFLRLCFLLVGREVLPVFLGFSRLWTKFSSAHFWSLLHWRCLSLFSARFCG